MCLQNRTLEEHNGRRKLLRALKWGVADPHSAIFIKASDRAKTALGQYWSRPRLSRNLPHDTQSYTCANAREIHTRARICLSGNNDQTRTCCRSPSSHYKGHIHRCEDCLICTFHTILTPLNGNCKGISKDKKAIRAHNIMFLPKHIWWNHCHSNYTVYFPADIL